MAKSKAPTTPTKLRNKRFGWRPDLPDARDALYKPRSVGIDELPSHVDLRLQLHSIPILNQGNLGSCTANALAIAHMASQLKDAALVQLFMPSRLFIYWNERSMEGTVNEDSGAMIRSGIKGLVRLGVCPETDWPYQIAKFRAKPPTAAYKRALSGQVLEYKRINNRSIAQVMDALAQGFPVVFGFAVYESFESPKVSKTGIYKPNPEAEVVVGGHAVIAVGYDKDKHQIIVRNSWGKNWGDNGHFYMDFLDISNENMADDFWIIKRVE